MDERVRARAGVEAVTVLVTCDDRDSARGREVEAKARRRIVAEADGRRRGEQRNGVE